MTVVLRPLDAEDGVEVARLVSRSKAATMPWLPVLHTPAEDVAFFTAEVREATGVGATEDRSLLGVAIHRPGWLNHLYVDPDRRGEGIGSRLLASVLAAQDGDLDLWAFQANTAALAFYARRGFEVVEVTDGTGNEERLPDVRLRHCRAVTEFRVT